MNQIKSLILSTTLTAAVNAKADQPPNDPISSWDNVPKIIHSITDENYREELKQLHQLTLIKLGYPQISQGLSDKEHQLYMNQTRDRWKEWWSSTGEEISKAKKISAKIDNEALKMAWDFLGGDLAKPESIIPVWIPETWTLCVTFTNGDYMGREKEIWMIHRRSESANLTKLRGDYSKGPWNVVLTKYNDLTPTQADQTLKALHYLHHYAPATGTTLPDNTLEKLYYPSATLHLVDGKNRILWNTKGYGFIKSRPEHGDAEAGRSYYFLKTVFSNKENWVPLSKPTSEELEPYRNLLSLSKPYFSSNSSEIIQLFGRVGSLTEKEAMLVWAAKQQAATNPKMDWTARSGDFSTELKVNVKNFTESELKQTLEEIKKIEARLAKASEPRPTGKPSNTNTAKD